MKNPIKSVSTWHKRQTTKWQDKLNLTDYQMMWLAFGKGLLIGIILL